MKILILGLLVSCAAAFPRDHDHDHEQHVHEHDHENPLKQRLPHFDFASLDASFQRYYLPDDADGSDLCSSETESCMKCGHFIAAKCMQLWLASSEGADVMSCESENEEVKAADQAWQEASSTWHVHLQRCLKGEDPPAEGHEVLTMLRRKRHMHMSSEEDCLEPYEDHRACWRALHTNKLECGSKIGACPVLARCMGRGPEPTDATEKQWYTLMKQCGESKQAKVREHLRLLHECLGHEEHQQLWEQSPQE